MKTEACRACPGRHLRCKTGKKNARSATSSNNTTDARDPRAWSTELKIVRQSTPLLPAERLVNLYCIFFGENRLHSLSVKVEASKQHTKHETTAHPGAHQRNPTRAHQPHMHEPTGACRECYASVAAGAATTTRGARAHYHWRCTGANLAACCVPTLSFLCCLGTGFRLFRSSVFVMRNQKSEPANEERYN